MAKEIAKEEIKVIEQTAQVAAERTVLEFKRNGLLKDNKQSAYQKTEILLYNYNNFQDAISEKRKQIKEVETFGTKEKSKSITFYSTANSFSSLKDEEERVEEKIAQLEKSILITKNLISVIDSALNKLKGDKYYDIIECKYFKDMTNDKIADYLAEKYDQFIDPSTVSRNKSRMINVLKIYLFSDDVVKELFS